MKNYNGIESRQGKVRDWLKEARFRGEYLLVSTKSDSIYSKKLAELKSSQKLIVDLYTPIFLEKELTLSKWKPQDWLTRFKNKEMVNKFLKCGNHFLVANHRQREYWLKTSQNLDIPLKVNNISVFPTGSGSKLPITNYQLPITDRRVILWFGGIYPWMEPGPLVEAFGRLAPRFPGWKLRFLGGWQPGTGYEKEYLRIKKSAEKKIPARQLEFIPWQAQDKLSRYLFDVGLAVHLVKPTPEDYYAHRVRLLSLTNAGIPVVTSGKDTISDLIVTVGAGKKVENDAGEIAEVVSKLLKSPKKVRSLSQRAGKIEQLYFRQETDMDGLEKFL